MNKFYQNYKDLFLSSKEVPFSNNLRGYHQGADHGKSYHPKHQNIRNILDENLITSQIHRVFNKYESGDQIYSRVKTQQSLAGKMLKQVVLPKLQSYDRQIESKLKRFQTQEKYLSNNSRLIGNRSSLYPEGIRQHHQNLDLWNQNFRKNKDSVKPFLLKNRLNSSHQAGKPSKKVRFSLKSAGKSTEKQPQLSLFMNPQNYLSQESQEPISFETEYQRSYSKKNIKHLQKSVIEPLNFFEQQNKIHKFHSENNSKLSKPTRSYNETKDLNEELQIKSFIKQKPDESKRNEIRFKAQYSKKEQVQNQSQNSQIKYSAHQPRRKKSSLRLALTKEEAIKFSEYENQFEFINKRLEHIQQFNNYYSHNCISSYKKAIAKRLNFKKRLSIRQNQLKQLLIMERVV